MKNLYAAGKCACQYHGANRLGGNSLLGALYGGQTAAQSAIADDEDAVDNENFSDIITDNDAGKGNACISDDEKKNMPSSYPENVLQMQMILREGLGIVRTEKGICSAIIKLDNLTEKLNEEWDGTATEAENRSLRECCLLGKAMLLSALERKESRGAHTRSDYPEENQEYQKQTIAELKDGEIQIYFRERQAKQPCLHGYLATSARVKNTSGVFDFQKAGETSGD